MHEPKVIKEQGKYTFLSGVDDQLIYEANLVRGFGLKRTQNGIRILTKKLDKFLSYVRKVNITGRFR